MVDSMKLDSFVSAVDLTSITPLCEIMTKFGSDKGNGHHHNYTKFYNYIFSNYSNAALNIFEVGLGSPNTNLPSNMGQDAKPGASLYGWREFFKYATIYGADVDRDILFTDERIQTFFMDQLNTESIKDVFDNLLESIDFDIIIDDGLHTFEANYNFLVNSIHKLKVGGIFIIEDILSSNIDQFTELLSNKFCQQYNIKSAKILKIPHHRNFGDNNLIVLLK